MKYTEILWEKVGAIAIASLIGAVYGLMVSPLIIHLFAQITVFQVTGVFCLVFAAIGVVSGDFLIKSTLGLVYTVFGFFIGLGVFGSAVSHEVGQGLRASIGFTLLGIVCGFLVVLIHA